MNILYLDDLSRLSDTYMYQYYGDLYRELKSMSNVYLCGDRLTDINDILSKVKNIDFILFGLGYFARKDMASYSKISGLSKLKIPKVAFIHKHQTMLEEKLNFCKINNFDLILDSQITYNEYAKLAGTDGLRIWFSANPKIYRPRQLKKAFDIGFSGARHGDGKTLGPTLDIRDRVHKCLNKQNKYNIFWNGHNSPGDRISSVEEYASTINRCKMWLATTGPYQDVGPRFFEVILSKTLLVCNRMEYQYEGVFVDEKNCIMFENNLDHLIEKIDYYLKNDEERNAIIENAYSDIVNNFTNRHMALKLLNYIKELR